MEQAQVYANQLIGLVVAFLPKIAGAINNLSSLVSRAMKARDFDISLQGFLGSLISVGLKFFSCSASPEF